MTMVVLFAVLAAISAVVCVWSFVAGILRDWRLWRALVVVEGSFLVSMGFVIAACVVGK